MKNNFKLLIWIGLTPFLFIILISIFILSVSYNKYKKDRLNTDLSILEDYKVNKIDTVFITCNKNHCDSIVQPKIDVRYDYTPKVEKSKVGTDNIEIEIKDSIN
jgi:hypothetical protein